MKHLVKVNLLPFAFCLAIMLGSFLISGGSWWAVGWGFFSWLCFVIVIELAFTLRK